MHTPLTQFEMASLLDTDEIVSEYLSQVLDESDTDELIRAVGQVAKAQGMAHIAKDSDFGPAACTRHSHLVPNLASIPL